MIAGKSPDLTDPLFFATPMNGGMAEGRVRNHRRGGTRAEVYRAILACPGTYRGELCRILGLGWSTVGYHLKVLEAAGEIELERSSREVRAYPSSMTPDERRWHGAVSVNGGAEVMAFLHGSSPATIQAIAESTGLDRRRVQRILVHHEKAGLVARTGGSRSPYGMSEKGRALWDRFSRDGQKWVAGTVRWAGIS